MERRLPLSSGPSRVEVPTSDGLGAASPTCGARENARCPVCGGEGELGTRCERDQRFRVEPAALARGDGDPLLGTVLGARFVVEAWLGLGSTAGLYRGRCLVSGTPCALKVLRDDGPTGALALELAAAEAQALGRARSPRVVALLGEGVVELAGGEARAGWLALELLGPSLGELAKPRAAAEREGLVLGALRDALLALGDLHAAGLAHGDLTPDHLRVRADGGAWVLVDLGSARPLGLGAAALPAPCSPGYAAPEREATGPTVSADLYALGRFAAYLLDARSSARGDAPATLLDVHTHAAHGADRARLGGSLRAWSAELTRAEPSGRPASACAALEALDRALSSSGSAVES